MGEICGMFVWLQITVYDPDPYESLLEAFNFK